MVCVVATTVPPEPHADRAANLKALTSLEQGLADGVSGLRPKAKKLSDEGGLFVGQARAIRKGASASTTNENTGTPSSL